MNSPHALPGGSSEQVLARILAERGLANGILPRGWIDGLILSNGTDATNDINISAGVCRSASNIGPLGRTTESRYQRDLEIPFSITKQLDVAWAPHTGAGSITGMRNSLVAIGDGTWHMFVMGGPAVPDAVFARSSSVDPSDVLPAGYTAWRRIGSIVRASAAIRPFIQLGDYFRYTTPIADSNALVSGVAQTLTTAVPAGLIVRADLTAGFVGSGAACQYLASPLDSTDSTSAVGLSQMGVLTNNELTSGQFHVKTNTSAQIRQRVDGTNRTVIVNTLGWWDLRGKDS